MSSHPKRIQSGARRATEHATRREFLALSLLGAAGVVGGVGLVGGTPVLAAARGLSQPSREGLQWREIRGGGGGGGVWVGIGGGGNTMVAKGSGAGGGVGALLVDTKIASFAPVLARDARARVAELTMVINTHHHADHTGGNFAIEALRRVAHEKAAPRIAAQWEQYLRQIRGALSMAAFPDDMKEDIEAMRRRLDDLNEQSWAPTETVAGSAEWTLGGASEGDGTKEAEGAAGGALGLKVEVHHFGAGHTDNDLVVRLPDLNVLHTGDLLFHNMHPYFDPPGGATCPGWLASVRKTIELCDAETVVIPGHGGGEGGNGGVTDVDGLKRQAEYLEKLWDEVGKLVDQGVEREEATEKEWPFMEGIGRPELRPRAIGAVFDERVKEGG